MAAPATTSLAQCAARYVRAIAIVATNSAAATVQRVLRRPGGTSTTTRPKRGDGRRDRMPRRERAEFGVDQRIGRPRSVDQRLQRPDAQLGRDDGAEERSLLPASVGGGEHREDRQAQRPSRPRSRGSSPLWPGRSTHAVRMSIIQASQRSSGGCRIEPVGSSPMTIAIDVAIASRTSRRRGREPGDGTSTSPPAPTRRAARRSRRSSLPAGEMHTLTAPIATAGFDTPAHRDPA